ncbi:hypothetical protein DRO66_03755 [Candidatus Bathyarchaeota archaeon]|nr:MAG: hypothetical protein DRO66_03755 [Candidatus Bathyarchaeota archaeon]
MKLTSTEKKMMSVIRAMREGRDLHFLRQVEVVVTEQCPNCQGNPIRSHRDGAVTKCTNSSCCSGKVHTMTGLETRVGVFRPCNMSFDTYEPVKVHSIPLSKVFLTLKGALRAAKRCNRKKKK